MSIALTSPVTGGAQTGFTSPTYTIVADVAPSINGKQYAVTALGGTQTGARVHSASDPFTITFARAASVRVLPAFNTSTGKPASVPRNVSTIIVRKGANIAANQVPEVFLLKCEMSVPTGSDAYDAANLRAAISLLVGALTAQSAGIGDLLATNVI
ncbi:coat protein [ssRNA phage Gephyllon.2_6]|jgi:hypothetical protein|uniref:Coat protein n=2 Tax=Norzivirales TaxID=2842247 RepID=A0A8S5L2X4_9VIRU|nr:coat protein [ssRNA phage Gephyllon.2_6]QDH87231.1 MAG: hypothetical protein H2BulkLitter11534_000002 [Leviviridae sp.]DAD52150.1 TPA_asm: coat protein [ssRNA phage Gephyllon.2_6]